MGTLANINPLLSSNITCLEKFFILMKNFSSNVFLWQNKKMVGDMYAAKKKKRKKIPKARVSER
jgi:hypothetical protein